MALRLLVISNYYPPVELGGWEQLTRDVVQCMRQRGLAVHVLTSNFQASRIQAGEEGIERVLHLESADPVRYHIQYTYAHRPQEAENKQRLAEAIARFSPQVIFINGMWNLPVSLAQAAENMLPGRVMYYMASYWPIEPDAHTAFWSDLNTASWKSLPKRLLAPLVRRVWLQSTPRNRLEFRRVLCVSAYLQEIMVHQAGIPRAQTRVVHNGIELELFSPRPGEVTDRPLRLLYAGRLSPDKGVDTVLESIAVLRRQNPELPVHLSLYGAGAPEYERRLRQAAQAAGITDRVAFAGLVPRIQMPRVLAAHDVLLFPSRWAEPLARIVQEAMACGLVVIGTATGGTPEILVDGHNGYIFPTDDAAALADKITRLAANRESWQRMAQAARQTVESRFSLKRMVDELIEEAEMLLTNVKAG